MTIPNIIVSIINAGFMVYSFMLFFSMFASRRVRTLLHISIIFAIALCATAILLFNQNRILNVVLILGIAFVTSLLYRFKWYTGILLSFLIVAVEMIAELTTTFLISFVFSVDTTTALTGIFQVTGILISKVFAFIIIILIRIFRRKKAYGESLKRNIIIMIIPISTITVLLLQYYSFVLMPNVNTISIFPSVICYSILIISNIVVLNILEQVYLDNEKETQLIFANKIIIMQKEQYQQLLTNNFNILRIQHDHKNFILGLTNLLNTKQYEKALMELQAQLAIHQSPHNSDCPTDIIGTIVSNKIFEANQKGILLEFSHSDFLNIKISEIDLAIILGNALDNAIEATQALIVGNKIISLYIRVHNNQIIIIVKNPVNEDVDVTQLKTTKKDPNQHGFGIISIKNIVDKYNGDVFFQCSNQTFEIHIVIKNTPRTSNFDE